MEPEKIKTLSKRLGNSLTKKNLRFNDLAGFGTEVGRICAQYFEKGSEEEDLDEFLFGFVNSVYQKTHQNNEIPKFEDDEKKTG